MTRPPTDPIREERIEMEIIVDAYDEGERALGWYYYLQHALAVPFRATCVHRRISSPLRVGQVVEVVGQPAEAECETEMLVLIRWPLADGAATTAGADDKTNDDDDRLAVPLMQLQPLALGALNAPDEDEDDDNDDDTTAEAVADWHYWVARGNRF